ncbi:hypothetical protein SKAU_G00278530 [Synaphobranchus kaupii]|uniref:Uncharacterized protein n=1 Tax=Synaphobranchus kaupii TaxID=118154 RepID=A0A9Q1EWP5_SYNKA|nr:hypothetical protein SKAU_G00278530 [Synaphobranchus kaupii]
MAPKLLKDIEMMSADFQTSSLESFHSVILKFASKSVAFSFLGMLCRTQLAAMHYNENSKQLQARTADGTSTVQARGLHKYIDKLQDLLFDCVGPPSAIPGSCQANACSCGLVHTVLQTRPE